MHRNVLAQIRLSALRLTRHGLFSLLALSSLSMGAETVFLQKIATLYPTDSSEVPDSVRQPAQLKPWLSPSGERAPASNLRLLASESSGVRWLGSSMGAVRFDPAAAHPWDRWHYFAGKRWLPDDDVQNIRVLEPSDGLGRTVWVRTRSGAARIDWVAMTLEEKALRLEQKLEARHVRHGMIADSGLSKPGDLRTSRQPDNDNDGLWTAIHLGAMCYRYAVTRQTEARERAERSMQTLMRLESITGIPGFPARSFVSTNEPAPVGGEWHATPDGRWLWKGDTSSDEIVGHYFGYALYFDLVANPAERASIGRVISRITDHLIRNDFQLIDLDGKPTLWGKWNETYFKTPHGQHDGALNSIELLAFLRTAHHITGDEKYAEVCRERIAKGYAHRAAQYRRNGGEINFSDDELAFLSYQLLFRYETDPEVRATVLEGLRATWSSVQPDRNPLWNYIAAASGAGSLNAALRDDSRRNLERTPLDLVQWSTKNSHRHDVLFSPELDRFGLRQLTQTLAPDERTFFRWNGNPYIPDHAGEGRSEADSGFFLLPYWMGRYHGWLR